MPSAQSFAEKSLAEKRCCYQIPEQRHVLKIAKFGASDGGGFHTYGKFSFRLRQHKIDYLSVLYEDLLERPA